MLQVKNIIFYYKILIYYIKYTNANHLYWQNHVYYSYFGIITHRRYLMSNKETIHFSIYSGKYRFVNLQFHFCKKKYKPTTQDI